MAIEYEMPLGMWFRKMYCAGCGSRLVRKQVRNTCQRGDPDFRNTLSNRSTINFRNYTTVTYVYRCPDCGAEISYEDQVKVAKRQAMLGKKVLTPEEQP